MSHITDSLNVLSYNEYIEHKSRFQHLALIRGECRNAQSPLPHILREGR